MNFDQAKLEACARECLALQTPTARAGLEALIAEGPIDVTPDPDRPGYVTLEIEGNPFGRVHESRLLRVPDDPGAN